MMMARLLTEGVECRTTESRSTELKCKRVTSHCISSCLGASVLKKIGNENADGLPVI